MNKFTSQINESNKPLPKFLDKTKQEIYSLIKESVTADISVPDGKSAQITGDANITLNGVDELTDKLYNYIQKEKIKGEINTLESIKTILVVGPFNYTVLNERLDELKKQFHDYTRTIDPRIEYFDEIINKFQNKFTSYEFQANIRKVTESENSSNHLFSSKDSENEFKKMIIHVNELKQENNTLNNRITLIISLSIISFFAAAIALVLKFI